MEFLELVKSRRSVRRYKAEEVSREDVLAVLECANWAPSAMNWQPWEFLVVSGSRIRELGENYHWAMEPFAAGRDDVGGVAAQEFLRFTRSFGNAPTIIAVLIPRNDDPMVNKSNLEGASAAMQNLLLAAADKGLGTCWMTGPMRDESSLRRILDIPDDREIVALTPLGWPESVPRAPPRADPTLERKVRWLD